MSATKRYCVVGVSTTPSVDAMATVAGGPGMSSLQAYQPPAAATPMTTERSAATLPMAPKSERAGCWDGVETAAGGRIREACAPRGAPESLGSAALVALTN